MTDKERSELDYLRFFFNCADFGPAHEDVVSIINHEYEDLGGHIPEKYRIDEDEDEDEDEELLPN